MSTYKLTISFGKVSESDNSGGETSKTILTEDKFKPENKNFDNKNFSNSIITSKDEGKVLDLSSFSFVGAKFRNTTFLRVKLDSASFQKADLSYANLAEISMKEACLKDANLTGAILTNANLQNAQMQRANLTNANLSNADLSKAYLDEANLYGVNDSGTNYTGSTKGKSVKQQVAVQESSAADDLTFSYSPYGKYQTNTTGWNESRQLATSIELRDDSKKVQGTCDLVSIKYNKEMYTHNRVDFILMFKKKGTSSDLQTWLDSLMEKFKKGHICLEYNGDQSDIYQTIAKNYFIFDCFPELKGDSQGIAYVHFRAFSPDKFLSLRPYSKAYTARRLFMDIVDKELLSGTFNNTEFTWKNNYVNQMNLLKLDGQNDTSKDLIQPYLVQYNEDLYNFLVRVLNQCGEFLYHEDGRLNFGCPNSYFEVEPEELITIDKFISFQYKEHTDAYDCGTQYFQTDYSTANGAYSSTNSHVCNSELGCNEYLGSFERDSATTTLNFKPWEQNLLWAIEGGLDQPTIADLAYFITENLALQYAVAEQSSNKKNKQIDNLHFKKLKSEEEEAEPSAAERDKIDEFETYEDRIGQDLKSIKLFSNSNNTINLLKDNDGNGYVFATPKFYNAVQEGIKKSEQSRMRIRLGANYNNLKLGSLIKFQGKVYLVVKIEGNCFSRFFDEEKQREMLNNSDDAFSNAYYGYQNNERSLMRRMMEDCTIEVISCDEKKYTFPTDSHRPRIINPGAQRVTITDNKDPNKLQRVRFRFLWQCASDDRSPWVRIANPMATTAAGFNMLPAENDEAIVNFENGNAERPYVEGMVYSLKKPPRLSHFYDTSRSISSVNGHTINFDDNPLDMQSFVNSFSPLASTITSFLGTSWTDKMASKPPLKAGGISMNDAWGMYKFVMSADKRMVMIDSPLGTVTLHAFTGINIMAPNGNIKIMGKNVDIIAGNKLTLLSGANMGGFIPQVEGKNDAAGQSLKYLGKILSQKLSIVDMGFVRTFWEALVRPVAGTLRIKSPRYLMLETGKGSARVPNRRWMNDHNAFKPKLAERMENYQEAGFPKMLVMTADKIIKALIHTRAHDMAEFGKSLSAYDGFLSILSVKYKQKDTEKIMDKLESTDLLEGFLRDQKVDREYVHIFVNENLNRLEEFLKNCNPCKNRRKKTQKRYYAADRNIYNSLVSTAHKLDTLLTETLINLTDNHINKKIDECIVNSLVVGDDSKIEKRNQTLRLAFDRDSKARKKIIEIIKHESFKWQNSASRIPDKIKVPQEEFFALVIMLIKGCRCCQNNYIHLPQRANPANFDAFQAWVEEFKKLNDPEVLKPKDLPIDVKIENYLKSTFGWEGVKEDKIWHFTCPNTIMYSNDENHTYEFDGTGQIKELKDYDFFSGLISYLQGLTLENDYVSIPQG